MLGNLSHSHLRRSSGVPVNFRARRRLTGLPIRSRSAVRSRSPLRSRRRTELRKMSGDRQQPLNVHKCQELIQKMLVGTGERDLLKRLIQSRLAQDGWTYTMRKKCIEYIKSTGAENVNVSQMIAEMIPEGVDSFPTSLRQEIADILWDFATRYMTVDDSVQPPSETDECANSSLNGLEFLYQSDTIKPEPGLGVNCPSPEWPGFPDRGKSPSPDAVPRPLTPQPPIPVLHPETIETEIKEEPVEEAEDESEMSRSEGESDEEKSEAENKESEESPVYPQQHHNPLSDEEELMDV